MAKNVESLIKELEKLEKTALKTLSTLDKLNESVRKLMSSVPQIKAFDIPSPNVAKFEKLNVPLERVKGNIEGLYSSIEGYIKRTQNVINDIGEIKGKLESIKELPTPAPVEATPTSAKRRRGKKIVEVTPEEVVVPPVEEITEVEVKPVIKEEPVLEIKPEDIKVPPVAKEVPVGVVPKVEKEIIEVSPESITDEYVQQVLREAEEKITSRSMEERLLRIKGRYGENVLNIITKSARELGREFDDISIKPKKLADGFERLNVILKSGKDVVQNYNLYLSKTGEVLDELGYNLEKISKVGVRISPQDLEASMGAARYKSMIEAAQRYGFQIDQLKKIYTQQPSGVTFATFEKITDEGSIYRMGIAVDRFGRVITQTNRRLLDFFSAIVRNTAEVIRWSIGATLVYQAMFKLQDLIRAAIDNESKLADITVILGNAQSNVNEIFSSAAKIANETGENINGVIEAYAYAYRAVGNIEEPLKRTTAANQLLSDSIILSKLSALDQAQAIDVLSGALRQMQKPGEDTAEAFSRGRELLDKWVAVTRRANVDLSTLATAFSITAESAENAGLSTEELNAIIASLSEKIGGLGGRETGNAVRAIIGGVYQQQAAEALGRFGITISDTTGKMRPFLDISKEIYALYKEGLISPDELNKIAYTLGGGVRRGQQYVAFLSDLERIQELVAIQANATGSAEEALGRKLETTQTSITQLSNSFQNLAQAMGERGGLLDIIKGVLDIVTALNNAMSSLIRTMGRVSLPLSVLTLASLIFRGRTGGLRYERFSSLLGETIGGATTSFLGIFPSMRGTTAAGGATTAERIGLSMSALSAKYLPALLVGSLPAISRAGGGEWKQAGIDIAGAIIGTLITGGSPVGATIGAAIAETFVSRTLDYEGEFENFFRDIFPPKTTGKVPTTEEERERLRLDVFAAAGRGSQFFGYLKAGIFSAFYNAASEVRKVLGLSDMGRVTKEQAALLELKIINEDEFNKYMEQLRKTTVKVPLEIQLPEVRYTEQQLSIINKLVEDFRREQLRKLYSREISPREYTQNMFDIQGFEALLTRMYNAFGDTFDKISDDVDGAEEVFRRFGEIILQGSEEDVYYIKQLTEEILILQEGIKELDRTGKESFVFRGEPITRTEALETLRENIETAANLMKSLGEEQRRLSSNIRLPNIISLDIRLPQLEVVLEKARELENIYKMALTPDEREKYEAEMELEKNLLEIFDAAGRRVYERLEGGPESRFITAAFEQLTKAGQIMPVGPSVGFQTFNVPYEQFARVVDTQYEKFLSLIEPLGYQRDEQYQIAIFNDGIIKPMSKDWKIVQYLLQQILDVNKKQLDGIYNLPAEASFYVPFQGYALGFQQGGGGGGGMNWQVLADAIKEYLMRTTPQVRPETEEERFVRRWEREKGFGITPTMTPESMRGFGYPPPRVYQPQEYRPGFEITPEVIETMKRKSEDIFPPNFAIDVGTTIGNIIKEELILAQRSERTAEVELARRYYLRHPEAELPKSIQSPDKNLPKLETRLNLNINSTTQLLVDGRVLATVVKQYLYEDLIRSQGIAGSSAMSIAM